MILSTGDILATAAGFGQPFWLAGLVLVGVPILLAAAARRRGRQVGRLSVVMQCAAIAALTLALARPWVQVPQAAAKKWLVLRDVSASTRTQQDAAALPPEIAPRVEYDFAAAVEPAGKKTDAAQTNLAPALRLAAARAGELAGVIVQTDGNFTDAHWTAAAESLGRSGLPVAIIAMERPPRDARIAEFTAARTGGGKVALRVSVVANAITESTIEISASDKSLLKREIKLLPSEPVTISLTTDARLDRSASFVATLASDDAFSENNRAAAAVGPVVRRVALVGAPGGYKPSGLASSTGMPVDALAPKQFAAAMENYAAVLLVDDSGQLLNPAQRGALARYVRHGGGLVILGAGPHRSPSDRLDPLNLAAALTPNPYDRKPVSLTIALDASGSMGQTVESAAGQLTKFDQAAEAVLSLKRHLTDRDTLRVIVFADQAREIYASGAAPSDLAKLAAALRQTKSTGATNILPALQLAAKRPPDAKRHNLLIIVSDLQTEKFDPPKAADMLKTAKLDLAIVAIASPGGAPSTEPLETLGKLLDAPLEKRDHLVGLARIFAGFLRTARGRPVRTGQFTLRAKDSSPAGSALDGKSADAYVISAPHDDSNVTLQIADDALAAQRTAGLGRSVSIALASSNGANAALLATAEFRGALASAVKWSARPAADARFTGELARSGGGDALLNVRAADSGGLPINMLKLSVRAIVEGDEPVASTPMLQIAPGRYAAKLALGRFTSNFHVTDAGARVVWRGGLQKIHPREFDAIGPNRANLRRLASLTAGRLVEPQALNKIARRGEQTGRWEVWLWLAATALALMLADWLARRTIKRTD